MCLRNGKGCADTVGNVLDAAISNVISRQSANEAALAAEAVGIRFSSYTGPLIAAAMTTPTIVNKVNSGDKLGAVGTGIDALLKYKVGAAAFTTCAAQAAVATAYFPVIVPYTSFISGMLCASISSGAIDATYTKLYEFATQPVVK
jgi:hypothetical protein